MGARIVIGQEGAMRMRAILRRLAALRRAPLVAIARRLPPSGRPDVVFLGDSITQFWLDHDPLFFGPSRINRGISGETTAQMLARFDRDVVALRPRAVHIMAGTNDLWHGDPGPRASLARANLAAMAEAARAHDIAVILAAPPPVAPAALVMFRTPELFAALRADTAVLCREQRLHHVDYARSLADADGVLQRIYTTDGVHLTARGYRAMRRQAEAVLRTALAPEPADARLAR